MPGPIVIDNEAGEITSGGSPLGGGSSGFPQGYREGLSLERVSATQIVVRAGSCRDQGNTEDITLGADTTVTISSLALGTHYVWIAKNAGGVSIVTESGTGTPTSPANSTWQKLGSVGKAEHQLPYTGTNQFFVVPAGVTALTAKLWGGGGGGGTNGTWNNAPNAGGAGGYVAADLAVSSGETLTLIVGEGGKTRFAGGNTTPTYGGGGPAAPGVTDGNYCASGGGRSAIRRSTTELVTAGGGGGGGVSNNGGVSYNWGGGGGGLIGGAAYQGNSAAGGQYTAAQGGTQSGGGTGGLSNYVAPYLGIQGSQFQGGRPGYNTYGGGGGGGYYGGGGGGYADNGSTVASMGGGGGGSSYVGGAIVGSTTNTQGTTASAGTSPHNQTSPPNTSDAAYVAGIGVGGAGVYSAGGNGTTNSSNGGNGLAVITYLSLTNTR